jgi:hypothetical protein
VKLRCVATSAGLLQNCAVVEETPAGNGFAAAALSLANGMELRPTAANGASVAGRNLIVPVRFEPALLHPGAVITMPDWARLPKPDELENYVPASFRSNGGRVVLHCFVTGRGLMDNCTTSGESPQGQGMAGAALAMTSLFVMKPMTVDGLPVGGADINIPIRFEGGGEPTSGNTVHVFSNAPWNAAPTLDQVQAAYPKDAIGKIASGHVVLRCMMKTDGHLGECDHLSETPGGAGFTRAAESLVKDFKVNVDPKLSRVEDYRIDVPFDFRDPSRSAPPLEVQNPLWVRHVDPKQAAAVYPEAAIKAGYKSGVAVLACSVAHTGVLTGCMVDSEAPADVGFGEAALKIAAVMAMNPWTQQGEPVDGMTIRLPIRLVLPDEPPAPAPATTPAK